jgi:hypothetical protein
MEKTTLKWGVPVKFPTTRQINATCHIRIEKWIREVET